MQQLLEAEQNVDVSAAQARVTPQELAQATAAIEARQNAIAQHEAATIPIGEAVHQLNLEATPEEVLAEVQAQRKANTQMQATVTTNTRSQSSRVMRVVIAAQTAIILGLGMQIVSTNSRLTEAQQVAQRNALIYTLPLAVQQQVFQQQNGVVKPATSVIDAQLIKSGQFHSLDIPIGQTAQCKYETIEKLANNADPSHTYTAQLSTGTTWQLTRSADGFYVNCWATMKDAEHLLNGQEAVVYATKAGAFDERPDTLVKIPIRSFQNQHIYATTDAPTGVVINGTH